MNKLSYLFSSQGTLNIRLIVNSILLVFSIIYSPFLFNLRFIADNNLSLNTSQIKIFDFSEMSKGSQRNVDVTKICNLHKCFY
jgi:hypothetical protein